MSVHNLRTINDGGILDPDDQLNDVVDDREQVNTSHPLNVVFILKWKICIVIGFYIYIWTTHIMKYEVHPQDLCKLYENIIRVLTNILHVCITFLFIFVYNYVLLMYTIVNHADPDSTIEMPFNC